MKYYIDSEIILQRRVGPIIYVYIMIITVVTLSLIIICILFRYKTYYSIKGIVIDENNHYYIRVYVPLDNVKYLINNKVVKIDKQNYTYKIISLDDEYFTYNITNYQIVKI